MISQRVLVVEDEEEIRTYLKQELSDEYKVDVYKRQESI